MNNPQYTPKQAIEAIDKEIDLLLKEEWDSSTLPDFVEWLGMTIGHTELKSDLSPEVRSILNRCTNLTNHSDEGLSQLGVDAQSILDGEKKKKPNA